MGGLGGFAEGDLAVTPGQTLEIFVGGQGCVQFSGGLGCGGFNGGGDANLPSGSGRGGGGGASDVRVGGTSLNDRVIVAAGGGGASDSSTFPGGNGGGLVGDAGGLSIASGQGGTQTSGGQGWRDCQSGEFGFGGDSDDVELTCAGGGGGWYGGGSGGGGGGGSSYIAGVTGGNTSSGQREGNGVVVLSWINPTAINLSPTTATNDVLTNHSVIATVETNGVPEPGILVTFEIISGPNTGEMSDPGNGECSPNNDCTTDANGQVSWTYTGSIVAGIDTIIASFFSESAQMDIESNSVEKIWVIPPRNVPTLSEWGLIAMAGILGIVGFIVLRRRRVAA